MTAGRPRTTRRRALKGLAAGGVALSATPTANGSESGDPRPDWNGWLDGVDGGYRDARGSAAVTVLVGAEGNGGPYAFSPAGLWVDRGATVRFEWADTESPHTVTQESGPANLDSGDSQSGSGVMYEYTFEESGITTYHCDPHQPFGMKGAVAVGNEVPTVGGTTPTPTATDTPAPPEDESENSDGEGGPGLVTWLLGGAGVGLVGGLALGAGYHVLTSRDE